MRVLLLVVVCACVMGGVLENEKSDKKETKEENDVVEEVPALKEKDAEKEKESDRRSECARLSWQEPPTWYGGSRVYTTKATVGCTLLTITSEYYSCDLVKPFTLCNSSLPNGWPRSVFHLNIYVIHSRWMPHRKLMQWWQCSSSLRGNFHFLLHSHIVACSLYHNGSIKCSFPQMSDWLPRCAWNLLHCLDMWMLKNLKSFQMWRRQCSAAYFGRTVNSTTTQVRLSFILFIAYIISRCGSHQLHVSMGLVSFTQDSQLRLCETAQVQAIIFLCFPKMTCNRSTWGDDWDSDLFWTTTSSYTHYNSTHVQHTTAVMSRNSQDSGSNEITSKSSTEYFLGVWSQ